MNRINFAWPEGKSGVLTTSWDDGTIHDRRLVEIFNKNGLKGTFNLNSGNLGGSERFLTSAEIKSLFAGHEVAVHTVSHPWLERQPEDTMLSEVVLDRRNLEALVGYPVRGMALPMGSYDQRVLAILKAAGIVYVRPVANMEAKFCLPGDFMVWNPTTHHNGDLKTLWDEFLNVVSWRYPHKLFYLWGHSYEFDRDKNWEHIEEFAEIAGKTPDIWHATNIQVYDYVTAWRNLRCSVDVTYIQNTTATTVWFRKDDKLFNIKPGEIIAL